MTDTTLNKGGAIPEEEWGASRWAKRIVAVSFCLVLLITLGVVFTRVIAARVPEQRATLEKLIAERTGLEVRFDNVHFAWDLDGTSAVFTRVELTDPKAGRIHVFAPELRVNLDSWDFLRHHRFSLGHVTLVSPDIEFIADPEESRVGAVTSRRTGTHAAGVTADESAVVRRYLGWAGLMPAGKLEVEGARVHLRRRGEPGVRHSFSLSQAVVSRSGSSFNAYGTMLLPQDVGQSLFVSAKLEGLGPDAHLSGDLRVIARRVFLDKLGLRDLAGRGTVDARLELRDGHVASGSWQASAREFSMNGGNGARFDHVSVNGRLARDGRDVLLDFTDLQLTRGARLERAPGLSARLSLAPGSVQVARTTVRAERVPFMAAELLAGLFAPQMLQAHAAGTADWKPTAGELRDLQFDSGEGLRSSTTWELTAAITGLDLARVRDQAKLGPVAARMRCDARGATLSFQAAETALLRTASAPEPRPFRFGGELTLASGAAAWHFNDFSAASEAGVVSVSGDWNPAVQRARPLSVSFTQADRAWLQQMWSLLADDAATPEYWAALEQATIVTGTLEIVPAAGGVVDWTSSRGVLELANLATSGEEMPRLADGRGKLSFARGGTQLLIESGSVEDLEVTGARIDWPRRGAPRLHASLAGELASPLVQGVLAKQGLEKLGGVVTLEADARGERELRDPGLWRVTARIDAGTMAPGFGLPPVEKLAGTIRYSGGQLRGLEMQGSWVGGPLEIQAKRGGSRGTLAFALSGVADAAPLLGLLGGADAAKRVSGQLAWTGTATPFADGAWQVTLASSLGGVESRLPAPFAKTRARALPLTAELLVGPEGIREFVVDGRELEVRGQVREGATRARFEVQGVAGELRQPANAGLRPELRIESLELQRAPAVLAAAGALLPAEGELALNIDDLHYATRSLGALRAALARQDDGLDFSLDSPGVALHQLAARGRCSAEGRCNAEFTAETGHLAALLRGVRLPAEWPADRLRASGSLEWPVEPVELTRALAGTFDLTTLGADDEHQLSARATLANGEILLADVQGTGPEPDLVYRGNGSIRLLSREYDLTVDYERVALAATAVPLPARARVARAWNALRGSVARRGWTEAPETRRVQWHGTWD